jgi:PPOX class probable FMN-dependent enzyme
VIAMRRIETIEALEAIYGEASEGSRIKETKRLTPHYRAYVEASPFCALATMGPEGLDCSPRGDVPGFVRVHDEETLMMPDRRGNNRVDSLRNIVREPRVALCFLVPGSSVCLRVNGEAFLTADVALAKSFAVDGKPPRSVIVIRTQAVYFQCSRAIIRAGLWDPAAQGLAANLPTAGDMLAALSKDRLGGPGYDIEWQKRSAETLW